MRNALVLLLVCFFFIQCSADDHQRLTKVSNSKTKSTQVNFDGFVGLWEFIDNPNSSDVPNGVYSIEIKKDQDEFIGKYCAIAQKGNRIDCSPDDEYNLDITVVEDHLEIKFYSFFGAEEGRARIELLSDEILWEVLEEPNGDYYMPREARFSSNESQEESPNHEQEEASNSQKVTLKDTYKDCSTIPFPIEYSYDFVIGLPGFRSFEDVPFIPEIGHLTDFEFAKLPSSGKTNLLLVSGYLESGQSELHLLALDQAYSVVDEIMLYTHRESEGGGVSTKFSIDNDLQITIVKDEYVDGKTLTLDEKSFEMDAGGHFSPRKNNQ